MNDTEARLVALREKLKARKKYQGFERNIEAIEAEIARLEASDDSEDRQRVSHVEAGQAVVGDT